MRTIRHFDPDALQPGEASDWLVGPEEDLGVTVRIRRGGGRSTARPAFGTERYALVLEGRAGYSTADGPVMAEAGEVIFLPSGETACVVGEADSVWAEIEAPLRPDAKSSTAAPSVIPVDPAKFEGTGFAYQALVGREMGAQTMRMNVLRVAPGAGSPDFHIHAFAQIYIIQDGDMTLDIGRKRVQASKNSVVVLPAGVVHRNFNASGADERHVSLLVPEPAEGEIFDFAVTIHDAEAQLLTEIPR
jgi:mannose-6-phosphate isomerase-like protein (cupin superfamily)